MSRPAVGAPAGQRRDDRRHPARRPRAGSGRRRRRARTVSPGRIAPSARSSARHLVRAERPVQAEPQPRPSPRPAAPPASRRRRSGPPPARRSGRPAARRRSGRGSSAGSRRPRSRRSATIARVVAAPPGPSRPSARRGSRPPADRRARAPARVAGARRRTAAGSGSAPPRRSPTRSSSSSGSRGSAWKRPYWRSVSRGCGARVDAAALEHQPDPRPERRGRRPPDRRPRTRDRARRPRAGSPRRSRPSSSCPRRSVRAARRARPRADRQRDAVEDGPRPVALDQPVDDDHRVAGRHGAIRAYWRSKSASVSSPIWIERMTPVRRRSRSAAGRRRGRRVLIALSGSTTVGQVAAVLADEVARRLDRVVGQDADDGQPVGRVLGLLRLEQRELVAAGDAARAPEVDDDGLAAEAREVERRPVERRPDDRPAPAAPTAARSVGPAGAGADEEQDAGRGHGRDEEREEDRSSRHDRALPTGASPSPSCSGGRCRRTGRCRPAGPGRRRPASRRR